MGGLKITGVEARAFTVPHARPIGNAQGRYHGAGWIVVWVHTDNGPTGTGLHYMLGRAGTAPVLSCIENDLAPLAIGKDALAPEALWRALWAPMRTRMMAGIGLHALSAIDIACWDIVGKAAGLSLNRLFGGYRQSLPVYGSGGWVTLDDASLLAECREFADQGITAYKYKVGTGHDVERTAMLRSEMGDDFTLMVDANQAFNVREAVELAERLADYDIAWFEEPVSAESTDDLAEMARLSPIPIAAGENSFMRWGFRELVERRAVAFIQPDAMRCGGITEWVKCMHLADAHNIALTSHLAHQLHVGLMGASPAGHLVEYINVFTDDLFTRDWPVHNGMMEVPDVPGHGVEFDRNALERLPA